MAGASTTKDVRIFMSTGTPATVVGVTGITAAKPAALTGAGMTLVAGDVVKFDKTGLANFDGKSFVASLPVPAANVGSVTIGGYVDPTASDFLAIKGADELGDKRIFRVTMPNGTFLLMEGILSGLTYGLELNQAITWSATITLTAKPRYTL